MNQMVLYPGLIKRDNRRNIAIILTGSGGSSTTIALNVTVVMMKMVMKVAATTEAMEVRPLLYGGCGSNRATALAWLSLVKDFGDDELAFFLFLVDAKMILMHYPISLLGFFLFAVVCVEHQDFLVASHSSSGEYWPCLAGLVPPCLATDFGISVDFTSLSCSRRVCLRWSVEEMTDRPVLAHSYLYV